MPWMVPSITATLLGTVALVCVYLYLYMQNRERYLGVWAASWALLSLRYVFELWMLLGHSSTMLLIVNQAFSLVSGLCLLWGTSLFMGKRISKFLVYGSGFVMLWIVAGAVYNVPFHVLTLPTFVILATIFMWTGISFLRCRDVRGVGSKTVGWAFIIWGAHKADYPFLRPVLWFAPWGYLASTLLQFIVAVGIILVYFEKMKSDLSASEQRFRLFTENARDIIYRYRIEPEPGFEYVSPSATVITGYDAQDFYADPGLLSRLAGSAGAPAFTAVSPMTAVYDEPGVMLWERKDGEAIWVEQLAAPVYDGAGGIVAFDVIARDITGRKRAEEELYFKSLLLDNATDSVMVSDFDGNIVYVNDVYCKTLGRMRDELIGTPCKQNDTAENMEKIPERVKVLLEQGSHRFESAVVHKDGTVIPVEVHARIVEYNGRQVVASIARDITERKKAEEMLNHLAYYDSLTDLPNRTLVTDRLNLAIANARRYGHTLAILCLDLDDFKTINDTLGHELGDELLKDVAVRLTGCLRDGDTVSRLGGDEFALLLPQLKNEHSIERVVEKIEASLKPPFEKQGREIHITTSIGIAVFPNDGDDAATLLKNADAALYRAKEQGRNTFEFYDEEIRDRASERLAVESSLRRAMDNQEFVVYYQPQVDLDSGDIISMEALIRWSHPTFGLVPPGDFIHVAEEAGLIVPIGEWVLREACRQNKAWQDKGYPHVRVAVNLSARQFQQPNLVQTIERILEETGLDARYLEIEITESAIMHDIDVTVSKLALLNDIGVNIAIDDFGTGYSSLSYLKRFPISILKIDRSFITDITTHAGDAAITRAIITLAHNLRLKAIAEGVETAEQVTFLRALGCDLMQGYLFSEPVPADDAARMLAEGGRLCA